MDMTKNIDQIRAAIAAIEAGKPDTDVDFSCFVAFGGTLYDDVTLGKDGDEAEVPNYCRSIDAIMAEMPEGWVVDIKTSFHGVTNLVKWQVAVFKVTAGCVDALALSDRLTSITRALLLALLRAMEAQADAS